MRIEIKYELSQGSHLIDLSADDLDQRRNATDLFVAQHFATDKSLHIDGRPDELELLAAALLNKAIELRRHT